jgi:two-component system, OmpR family, sensor kinase
VLGSVGVVLAIGTVLVRDSVRDEAIRALGEEVQSLSPETGLATDTPVKTGRFLIAGAGNVAVLTKSQAAYLIPKYAAQIRAGEVVTGTIQVGDEDKWFAARPSGTNTVILSRPARIDLPIAPILAVAGGVGALLAGLVALAISRAVARPVQRVSAASRVLAEGQSPEALPEEGPAEVRALARAFNHMSSELDRARQAERVFLLSVSHELKTPLTAIRGNAEALADGVVSPERAASVIAGESRRLQRLVQDLLDLARLNVRSFSVRRELVDLGAIVEDVVERHRPAAERFGVELVGRAPGDPVASCDHDRLLQVVSNLVENALRCTPAPGTVSIEARDGWIAIDDTGPGLTADDVPKAFDRFYLYDKYGRDRPVGTGLGLAVVRELTSAMGGDISIASQPGKTRFEVHVPVPEPTEVGEPVPVEEPDARV